MKYLLFTLALLGILPAAFWLSADRKWIRLAALMIPLAALVHNQTSINFFSHETYRGSSRGMEISIVYLCAATILLTLFLIRGRLKLFPDLGIKIYFFYFLYCIFSILNAENALYSYFEIWKMLMMFLIFLAIYHYLQFTGDLDTLMYAISFVVLFGFLFILQDYLSGRYQARGVFPHQNSLGMYMLLAGTLFFSRFFNGRGKLKDLFFAGVFLIAALSLLRTFSRGAIACFPLGCGITMAASLFADFNMRKLQILIPITICGMLVAMLFLPRIIERFEKAPEASGNTRINLAIAAKNMMKDKPFLGVGINNWGIKINPPYQYSEHREAMRMADDVKDGIVETIYLLVGAECGIPALLLLLTWFGYYWIVAFRLLKSLRHTEYFYIPAGLLGGLSVAYLQSILEWILKQPVNFIQLIIFFAILSYLNVNRYRLRKEARRPGETIQNLDQMNRTSVI